MLVSPGSDSTDAPSGQVGFCSRKVPTFFAGCGSKKPWQSEEQQLERLNYPHFTEFHSDALTLTSCWPLQTISGKGGKDETRKQEIWWFFMFWVCFPNVHEYFKLRKKYLCSPSTEIQYMFLMQKTSSFETAIMLSMHIAQSMNVWMVTVLLVMSYCFTVFGKSFTLQTMIDWSVTFASLHCSDLASYLHLSSSTLSLPPQAISIWLSWESFIASAAPL